MHEGLTRAPHASRAAVDALAVWFQYAMLRSRRAANRGLLLTTLVCRFPASAGALKAVILTTLAAGGVPQDLDFPGSLR